MSPLTRRDFLRASATAAAASQLPLFVSPSRAGAARAAGGSPLLMQVFLRGGADGLALLPKRDDPSLEAARAPLLPADAIPFGQQGFALHPALEALAPYAQDGRLAAVCGVGLAVPQRSHFEAQDLCERAGEQPHAPAPGWLARALARTGDPPSAFRAFAAGSGRPLSLAGDRRALAFASVDALRSPGRSRAARAALATLFDAQSAIGRAGGDALEAIDALRAAARDSLPGEESFRGRLGRQLATLARVARSDLGLVAACVDVGGWDTHVQQGAEQGQLAGTARELAEGLDALLRSLESRMDDLLVLVVTEFGRTVEPNGSGGTDHGRASVAFALGGAVNGGSVFGSWPGASREAREEGRDLRVTTDLRHVLAEGARHLGARDLASVFPDFAPRPTGVLKAQP